MDSIVEIFSCFGGFKSSVDAIVGCWNVLRLAIVGGPVAHTQALVILRQHCVLINT